MMWSMFLVAGVLPEVHEQMSVQSERPHLPWDLEFRFRREF